MYRTAVILLALSFCAFQAVYSQDITYEVRHASIDSAENPIDVYTMTFYDDGQDKVELSKYKSKRDEYYFLSLTSVGDEFRYMSRAIVVDIDGFTSEYRYSDPFREISPDGTFTEVVTVVIDHFILNDMISAVNLQIRFQTQSSFIVTFEGIENIVRFVSEMREI